MVRKTYCEYFDEELKCVTSETRIYFLGLLVYKYTTHSKALNAIYSYIPQEEENNGLYTGTNIGFNTDNINETEKI